METIVETTIWQNFIVKMESLTKNNWDCHRQSSKSFVTLGAVWRTLTLAGEEPRSQRSLHILNLGPNHLHESKVLLIICVFFNKNV